MKIYISTDMEGMAGIVYGKSTMPPHPDYERYRKLMTAEVNAAIEGAFEAGAETVVVNDGHGSMRNITIEDLHPDVQLISGYPKPLLQMTGIDESFDGAMFIGFHAKSRSHGVLAHTFCGFFEYVKVNNHVCSEAEFDALVAGSFNVPVLLVSGDNILKEQIKELMPSTLYVQTKESIGAAVAKSLHPKKIIELLKNTVKTAINTKTTIQPVKITPPYTLEIKLSSVALADVCEVIPGVVRLDETVVTYSHENMIEISNMLTTMYNAGSVLSLPFY